MLEGIERHPVFLKNTQYIGTPECLPFFPVIVADYHGISIRSELFHVADLKRGPLGKWNNLVPADGADGLQQGFLGYVIQREIKLPLAADALYRSVGISIDARCSAKNMATIVLKSRCSFRGFAVNCSPDID